MALKYTRAFFEKGGIGISDSRLSRFTTACWSLSGANRARCSGGGMGSTYYKTSVWGSLRIIFCDAETTTRSTCCRSIARVCLSQDAGRLDRDFYVKAKLLVDITDVTIVKCCWRLCSCVLLIRGRWHLHDWAMSLLIASDSCPNALRAGMTNDSIWWPGLCISWIAWTCSRWKSRRRKWARSARLVDEDLIRCTSVSSNLWDEAPLTHFGIRSLLLLQDWLHELLDEHTRLWALLTFTIVLYCLLRRINNALRSFFNTIRGLNLFHRILIVVIRGLFDNSLGKDTATVWCAVIILLLFRFSIHDLVVIVQGLIILISLSWHINNTIILGSFSLRTCASNVIDCIRSWLLLWLWIIMITAILGLTSKSNQTVLLGVLRGHVLTVVARLWGHIWDHVWVAWKDCLRLNRLLTCVLMLWCLASDAWLF